MHGVCRRTLVLFEDGTGIPISGQSSHFRHTGFGGNLLTCNSLCGRPTGLPRAIS
jgi:hypothetical protein